VSINFKLGRALRRQGLCLEAEETLRRALAAEQELVGAGTPMVAEIVSEICKVKVDTGDAVAAGQLAAHCVGVWWGQVHDTRHAVHPTIICKSAFLYRASELASRDATFF